MKYHRSTILPEHDGNPGGPKSVKTRVRKPAQDASSETRDKNRRESVSDTADTQLLLECVLPSRFKFHKASPTNHKPFTTVNIHFLLSQDIYSSFSREIRSEFSTPAIPVVVNDLV